jgi:isocitrate dehydrogenase
VKVYPDGLPETFCTDHWRCRFVSENGALQYPAVLGLLERIHNSGFEIIKTEHLYQFDGQRGYSLGQGE